MCVAPTFLMCCICLSPQAFSELKNLLCALSSVPLTIKQIWHSDAALRHTEVQAVNTWDGEEGQGKTTWCNAPPKDLFQVILALLSCGVRG